MMLRSRNVNTANNTNVNNQQKEDLNSKRGKKVALTDLSVNKGEPKPKRAALADLSKAISNVLIDSSKKVIHAEKKLTRRSEKRNSETALETVTEQSEDIPIVNVIEDTTDPCPGYDFDKESGSDPFAVHQYAFDIFRYYKSREDQFAVGDYLSHQPTFEKDVRAALVDWMVEVQETFELNHETLYLGVKMVDLYLATMVVDRNSLQLVACAAYFLACKFDERSPPLIEDFLYIAEELFTKEDLIDMEMKMLNAIGYDLGCPLSYRYLRRFARVCKQDMHTLTLARYILETSLMFYEFVGCDESRMAAACFLLALKMKRAEIQNWDAVLEKYSGYTEAEVEPLMWEVNHMLHVRRLTYPKLQTVRQKYCHEVFYGVGHTKLIPDQFDLSRGVSAPKGMGFKY